eukprot:XP_011618261.1 PREDICTED: transthyretin-like isoform X1 [Takifugu rubripes]
MLQLLLLASVALLCHAAPILTAHGGSDTKCPVTVKILDAVKGTPAGPMALNLYQRTADGGWTQVANGMTDASGEIHNLITEQKFLPGVYRVDFDTKSYWKNEGSVPFHEVTNEEGAHKKHESSPPGLHSTQGTDAALQGAGSRSSPPGHREQERHQHTKRETNRHGTTRTDTLQDEQTPWH